MTSSDPCGFHRPMFHILGGIVMKYKQLDFNIINYACITANVVEILQSNM